MTANTVQEEVPRVNFQSSAGATALARNLRSCALTWATWAAVNYRLEAAMNCTKRSIEGVRYPLEHFAAETEPLDVLTPIDVLHCIDPDLKFFSRTIFEQACQ